LLIRDQQENVAEEMLVLTRSLKEQSLVVGAVDSVIHCWQQERVADEKLGHTRRLKEPSSVVGAIN
jgi:hypothetical protein